MFPFPHPVKNSLWLKGDVEYANGVLTHEGVSYPDSDGMPMADNTLQWGWIVAIAEHLRSMYAEDPNVFVASDLLWYPVKGEPKVRTAPDVVVAFGRPKGYRGSYIQHREDGVAPQVAFEILSPNNTDAEMEAKLVWYSRYGVEEVYYFYPDEMELRIWVRDNGGMYPVEEVNGFESPRMGVRFTFDDYGELVCYRPNGQRFRTHKELEDAEERQRQRAEAAIRENERLKEQLRSLGIDPNGDTPGEQG